MRHFRRARHIRSQMKFFGSKKWSNLLDAAAWKRATKRRDGLFSSF